MADEPERLESESPDLAAEKLAALTDLFPGVIADGVLDAARLGELLDIDVAGVAEGKERYALMWAGKQEAVRSLLEPSRGTLIPDLERSIEFDTAENIFIEGDNLEVLKLLQKSYNDQVKLIYIDPPYNTGNDFVYEDSFSDGLRAYLMYTGQLDEAGDVRSAKPETAGRKHSRWLTMMYPRLLLARNLLTQDGVIAVSIDRNEQAQLKLMMDEIFGSENALGTIVWVSNLKGRQIADGGPVGTHEYILLYARRGELVGQFRGSVGELSELMPSVYKGGKYKVKEDSKGPFVTKNQLYNTNSKFNEKTAPTMVFRIHYNFETAEVRVTDIDDESTFDGFVTAMPHKNSRSGLNWHAWRWSRDKILAESDDLEFEVRKGQLRIWTKIRDIEGVAVKDLIMGPSTMTGQADLEALDLARVFDNPKPVSVLQVLVSSVTGENDLVLDFFAGSGSTAHAVAAQNARDGGSRRCISVNLPEPTAPDSVAAGLGFETISAITHERLVRVMDGVSDAREMGLRTFALGRSNFRPPDPGDGMLLESSTIDGEAAAEALVAEILLKEGVPLDIEWTQRVLGDAEAVSADVVTVITDLNPDESAITAAIDLEPQVLVLLEDGLAGKDALKANAFYACQQAGVIMKTI